MQSVVPVAQLHYWAWLICLGYLLSVINVVMAISQRFAIKSNYICWIIIVLFAEIGVFYFSLIQEQRVLRVIIIGLSLITLYLIPIKKIWRAKPKHQLDHILRIIYTVNIILLIIRQSYLYYEALHGVDFAESSQSLFWVLTQFNTLLFCFTILSVIVGCNIQDLVVQLEKERGLDPLTGIANRRYFLDHSKQYLTPGGKGRCALFICDIDDFKKVNDQYGHQVGDEVLQSFVHCIKSELRYRDILVRMGGEEFVGIIQNVDLMHAKKILENIQRKLTSHPFYIQTYHIQITASFGLVMLDNYTSIEEAIVDADRLMYEMKSSGKNGIKYLIE
ncbi:GGDEF domain-containing protein [Acinetobacter qingfengensis]|nr:GGDEF domain-containing protein [Acinetobacter qingfengensis]